MAAERERPERQERPTGRGRRGNGEGSIYKRADGKWIGQITVEPGRRKSFTGATRQDVQKRLTKALREREQGLPLVEERQTVAQYLADWLATVRPPKLNHETWRRYEACVRLHITPEIGRTRLAQLSAQQVQRVYAQCLIDGLSSTTTKHVHAVLHRALASALRLGLVARNVADMVERPKKRAVEIHPFTQEQALTYRQAAEGQRLEALFVLALATGMRIGELLALRWAEVDLERRHVRVVATLKWREGRFVWDTPKTKSSRRQIAIETPIVALLMQHRTRQKVERLAAGEAWCEQGLVFTDEIGRPLSYFAVRRKHNALCKSARLPVVRIHDLRHTAATLLLSAGVNTKIVSEMLGHSSVAITMDVYQEVLPHMQQNAAAAMAAALGW